MNIQTDRAYTIFRHENQIGTYYSISLSHKKQDGSYENGYVKCSFKKGVSLQNKAKIYLKNAWVDFYKNKKNETVPYIFINEFETVDETINNSKNINEMTDDQIIASVVNSEDPFEQFSNEISEEDLPW